MLKLTNHKYLNPGFSCRRKINPSLGPILLEALVKTLEISVLILFLVAASSFSARFSPVLEHPRC